MERSKVKFDNLVYEFDWLKILLFAVGTPLLSIVIFYSHNWVWLHEISAKITVWVLNQLTNGKSFVDSINLESSDTPWKIYIVTAEGVSLSYITFETLCTGIHAIAIFVGVILFAPHSYHAKTNENIWNRKFKAIAWTAFIFYLVNIFRMVLQLYLYRNGSKWDDVHYSISSASSFIAVACVLIVNKFVPEFIMSLIWIGEDLKRLIGSSKETEEVEEQDEIIDEQDEIIDEQDEIIDEQDEIIDEQKKN